MKRIASLVLLVVVGVALQNNFPTLQLVVLLLPLSVAVALTLYRSPSNHVMAVVGVCLFYGSLSGTYVYSAGIGLAGLVFVWLAARLQLPVALIGIGLTAIVQLSFVIVSGTVNPLVLASFATQLVAILVVSFKLSQGVNRVRV